MSTKKKFRRKKEVEEGEIEADAPTSVQSSTKKVRCAFLSCANPHITPTLLEAPKKSAALLSFDEVFSTL